MRIVMITENDPAGVCSLLRRALTRHTDHSCRIVTLELRYNHLYEKDLHVPWLDDAGLEELESVLDEADVFHFHMLADEHMQLGPFTAAQFLDDKKRIVHHHHGHHVFRGNPEIFQKKYADLNRKNLLVSTPDLLFKLPAARWQPNLIPEHDSRYMPNPRLADGKIRIAHSPTRKDLKNTDDLLAVHDKITSELPHFELDMIDNATHNDCLARKQSCDIAFDHMQGYYGMASLEALSQGLPTIAGLSDHTIARIREYFGCDDLPWVIARHADELETALRHLALDDDEREQRGAASRHFMETVWTEKRLTTDLATFYEELA
ncbi:glycosyltransferase [Desulfovibrio inopinatus]|uniref:glycosyltransferase n=1 Tax=Desulfovibrio inopinatus TaxID=102109 RepID=UPI000427369B|nr:glycosyltransferase [Desulfovibrio inopinatus]